MEFLKKECRERGATIIYATHIFDGLENWPSHIVRCVPYFLLLYMSLFGSLSKFITTSVSFVFLQLYVARGKLQFARPMDKVKEISNKSLMVREFSEIAFDDHDYEA